MAQRGCCRQSLARAHQLVNPPWLLQVLQGHCRDDTLSPQIVICEVSWKIADASQAGHIPSAQSFTLQACEQAPQWTRVCDAVLAAQLLAHGITHSTTVVLYGQDTTAVARAAVLMLYAGVDDVRLLDGGLHAWCAVRYPLSPTLQRPVPASDFGTALPQHPEYLLDTTAVRALLGTDRTLLVSVQSWAEYVGACSGYAYITKTGRITGAVWGYAESAPHRMDYYRQTNHTMQSATAIIERWRAWGITPDKHVVFYCGTGWRASEAFFYAYLMGWPTIAVYDGGWWQWSQDPGNPIASGPPDRRSPSADWQTHRDNLAGVMALI